VRPRTVLAGGSHEEVAVIGSTGWAWVAAVLCLGVGLLCLVLAAVRIGDRTEQLAHAAMSVAMAGMFSPWGDPVPRWIEVAGFAVVGAWFGALALRRAGRAATHLTISSAAMVLMYLLHGHPEAAPGAAAGAHAGHSAAGAGVELALVPFALVLAGYFAWHTWTCVDRCRAVAPQVARSPARVEPVAHGLMSALMATMFLGAI
jgi:Domain of unknown function (DUF5134)